MPRVVRTLSAVATVASLSSPALANTPVTGLWLDHTGRGIVEIAECGSNLCGRLVWLKDNKNAKACGTEILGNVKPVAGGKWDDGWIYDPDEDSKYSVELTQIGADKLKVLGYAGSKLFSETMMWTRAPADITRCDAKAAIVPGPSAQASEPKEVVAAAPAETQSRTELETETPTPQASAPTTTSEKPRQAKRRCRVEFAGIEVEFPCP